MEDKDLFNNLLKDKLDNFESSVRPEIWSNVSSAISNTSSISTGLSLLSKVAIGVSVVAATVTSVLYFTVDTSQQEKKTIETPKQQTFDNKEKTPSNNSLNRDKIESIKFQNRPTENVLKEAEIYSETPVSVQQTSTQYSLSEKVTPNSVESISTPIAEVVNTPTITETPIVNENQRAPKSSDVELILPNIFTPNDDGSNDILTINMTQLEDVSLVVLNMKGQVQFTFQGTEFMWDGRDKNGDLVPSGSYIYFITGKDNLGKLYKKYTNLEVKY